jgi:hypothetical protein
MPKIENLAGLRKVKESAANRILVRLGTHGTTAEAGDVVGSFMERHAVNGQAVQNRPIAQAD